MLEAVITALILVAIGGTYCMLQLQRLIAERHNAVFTWQPLKADDLATNIQVMRAIWGPGLEKFCDAELLQLRALLRGASMVSAALVIAIFVLLFK